MSARGKAGEQAMAEIVAAVGNEPARILAVTFGGTSLYVPLAIGDHHPICAAIGRESADLLAAWAGGGAITIPKQPERRARVRQLKNQGKLTIAQIAVQTSFHERHVYRLLRDTKDADQYPLFED